MATMEGTLLGYAPEHRALPERGLRMLFRPQAEIRDCPGIPCSSIALDGGDLVVSETLDREMRVISVKREYVAILGWIVFELLEKLKKHLRVAPQSSFLFHRGRSVGWECDDSASP
jgi:hypothetical protein